MLKYDIHGQCILLIYNSAFIIQNFLIDGIVSKNG
jgi:hypothetical protein